MKRSELILEYIDGTLDGNAEQQLFEELARQPEFRSEMRQYIVIGEAVRADREAFLPPRDLENSLMAGLGLAPLPGSAITGAAPAATAPAAGVATGLLAKLGLLKGMLPFIAAFMLGGLLVGGGVYVGMHEDSSSTVVGTTSIPVRPSPSLRSESSSQGDLQGANALPLTSDNAASTAIPPTAATPSQRRSTPSNAAPWRSSSNRGGAARNGTTLSQSSAVDNLMSASSSTRDPIVQLPADTSRVESTRSAPALIDDSELREWSERNAAAADSALRGSDLAPSPVPPIVIPRTDESPQPSLIAVEVRGISTALHNRNQAKVKPDAFPGEVFAAGIHYRADDSYQFGIEAGRERFYQTYHFSTDVGSMRRVVRIDQAPMLYWIGISGRFNTPPLFEGVAPFLQMTIGGALNHGPMARGRVGMRSEFGSMPGLGPIAMTVSAEGSALLYFYGSETMASTNAGGSIGLEVGLW